MDKGKKDATPVVKPGAKATEDKKDDKKEDKKDDKKGGGKQTEKDNQQNKKDNLQMNNNNNNLSKAPKIQERPPEYLDIEIDPNEFHQRYNQFLEDDKQNKTNQAKYLADYLEHTGLSSAFKIICAELFVKEIDQDQALTYTAKRLREIGNDLIKISQGKEIKELVQQSAKVKEDNKNSVANPAAVKK